MGSSMRNTTCSSVNGRLLLDKLALDLNWFWRLDRSLIPHTWELILLTLLVAVVKLIYQLLIDWSHKSRVDAIANTNLRRTLIRVIHRVVAHNGLGSGPVDAIASRLIKDFVVFKLILLFVDLLVELLIALMLLWLLLLLNLSLSTILLLFGHVIEVESFNVTVDVLFWATLLEVHLLVKNFVIILLLDVLLLYEIVAVLLDGVLMNLALIVQLLHHHQSTHLIFLSVCLLLSLLLYL